MAKQVTFQQLFENCISCIMADKKDQKLVISHVRTLAAQIENAKLTATSEICALVAKQLQPMLQTIGMPKSDRWFRKYLDAKYKRPQKLEAVEAEKLPAKSLPKTGKTRLRVNVENPQDEGRTETCPDCQAKTPNPKNLGEIVCSGCGETFYISEVEQETEQEERRKCARCHHLESLHKDDDDMPAGCGGAKCKCPGFTLVKPEDAKKGTPLEEKTADVASDSTLIKAVSKIKASEDHEAIVPFATFHAKSGVGFSISWNKVPTFLQCQNPDCHHHKVRHGLFATKGQHKCEEQGCSCKDFIVDTRKLPESMQKKMAAGARDGGPEATQNEEGQQVICPKCKKPLGRQVVDTSLTKKPKMTVFYTHRPVTDCAWHMSEKEALKQLKAGGQKPKEKKITSTVIFSLDFEGVATNGDILPRLLTGPDLKEDDPLHEVQKALRENHKVVADMKLKIEQLELQQSTFNAKFDEERPNYNTLLKEVADLRQTNQSLMSDRESLSRQLKEVKKELAERATKAESEQVDLLKREMEEYKSVVSDLKSQLASASFTTADQVQEFEIFVPKKHVPDLVKTIDTMNWKKAPGISIRTDGKFGSGFKVGAPE